MEITEMSIEELQDEQNRLEVELCGVDNEKQQVLYDYAEIERELTLR
jgi:hypothetical protein